MRADFLQGKYILPCFCCQLSAIWQLRQVYESILINRRTLTKSWIFCVFVNESKEARLLIWQSNALCWQKNADSWNLPISGDGGKFRWSGTSDYCYNLSVWFWRLFFCRFDLTSRMPHFDAFFLFMAGGSWKMPYFKNFCVKMAARCRSQIKSIELRRDTAIFRFK